MRLKPRQRAILQALRMLGGTATTRQIAERTGFNVNGVSQSLGALSDFVEGLDGEAGDFKWRLKRLPTERR